LLNSNVVGLKIRNANQGKELCHHPHPHTLDVIARKTDQNTIRNVTVIKYKNVNIVTPAIRFLHFLVHCSYVFLQCITVSSLYLFNKRDFHRINNRLLYISKTTIFSSKCWYIWWWPMLDYVQSEIGLKMVGQSKIGLGQCRIENSIRPISDLIRSLSGSLTLTLKIWIKFRYSVVDKKMKL
jgi:hypothetical protein